MFYIDFENAVTNGAEVVIKAENGPIFSDEHPANAILLDSMVYASGVRGLHYSQIGENDMTFSIIFSDFLKNRPYDEDEVEISDYLEWQGCIERFMMELNKRYDTVDMYCTECNDGAPSWISYDRLSSVAMA